MNELTDVSDLATTYPMSDAQAGGILAIFAGMWLLVVIIGIISLIIWIWAIIDCAKRQFPGNSKTIWIIVLIVSLVIGLGLIGAIVYLIAGKKQGTIAGQPAPVQANTEQKK